MEHSNSGQAGKKNNSKKFTEESLDLRFIVLLLLFGSLVSALLYFGKALFIPLSIAVLISFMLYPPCAWLEKRGIKRGLAITITHVFLLVLVGALFYLLVQQFINFSKEWGELSDKIQDLVQSSYRFLNEKFNISIEEQESWLKNTLGSSGMQVIPFLRETTYSISVLVVFLVLIPIISALILYYRKLLLEVLNTIFPGNSQEVIKTLQESVTSYYNFVKGMIIVYLIVGTLNSIGLAIVGIPHPILFGFIASVLTIIPYVGIAVASLLPMTIGWITFNSIWYPVAVIIVFGIVQFLEANIIFPFAVGNRLKINTLATIVTILAGGVIWGAAGMILFMPFVAILKLIADKSERLKIISILLGTDNYGKK